MTRAMWRGTMRLARAASAVVVLAVVLAVVLGVATSALAAVPEGPAVTNTNDSGTGSLRQAILDANATAQADTIAFDIPGTGARVITPTSPLPQLTSPVTVDGTTQPGYAGKPVVVLSGADAGADASGLDLWAGNSTVRGLVVNSFAHSAIRLVGGEGNVVESCYLGTDASGTRAKANGNGIVINDSASNTIGGRDPGQGNVISGNAGYGVNVEGDFGENRIVGNLIGTDASGTAELGNTYSGVRLGIGVRNASVAANVIAANGTGVELFGYAANPLRNNVVWANHIGTDRTGAKDLGNFGYGVKVVGARFTDVLFNTVAFNRAAGVAAGDADGTRINQNAVYANGPDDPSQGLGIDLGGDGVTPNDPGDADEGPNGLQNFPVLTSAETIGGSTVVKGTLDSTPNTAFGIEFFSNPKADPTGHGEGRFPLSSTNVTTDGSGEASFAYTTEEPVPAGHVVAATATPNDQISGTFSTSEFSETITVTADATRPTIGGVSPKHRSTIRDTTPTIRAVVKDDVTDLQKADIRLYVNGALIPPKGWSFVASTDALVYNSPKVARGKKTVRIVATDAAGNVGAKSWYFTIA